MENVPSWHHGKLTKQTFTDAMKEPIMPEISSSKANLWSKLGSRATYGQAISMLAEEDQDMLAMSADLGNSSGLAPFIRKFQIDLLM